MTRTVFALALLAALPASSRDRAALNGKWEFRLDPAGVGERERFHSNSLPDSIQVPGSWQAQGFGEPAGILRHHYAGAAWYRRVVPVPAEWKGKRVVLSVGGAHRGTTLYVNGNRIGQQESFSAPLRFDITEAVRAGDSNSVALRIENPDQKMEDSPDKQKPQLPTGMLNYIGNWGGIYGDVNLEATGPAWIDSASIACDSERDVARFRFRIANRETGPAYRAEVRVSVQGAAEAAAPVEIKPGAESESALEVRIPNARHWSPEDPYLYRAAVRLVRGNSELDSVEERFGMRQVSTRGNVLLLNGKPVYLRGYGDDNIEVLTGFPPASKDVFLDRLRTAKSYGFNAVRFHSMVPPEAYFEAADEAGLLVMAELPAAYTQHFFAHREFLRRELVAVLLAYRNHPSLLSLAFGNEFNLRWLKTDEDRKALLASLAEFYRAAKELAPATLILSTDGFDLRPTDMVSLPRGSAADLPTVRHEFGGYYCSLPDPSLIPRFTGVIAPVWLETKRKWIEAAGLSALYPRYLRNSRRLLDLGHKYQIERTRLMQDVTGYHYWLIVDFPGGTGEGDSWEEGWLDYFWGPKSDPAEGREINSAVLPLIGAGPGDRTLWVGERKRVELFVSNYGEREIRSAPVQWTLSAADRRVAGGTVAGITVPLGAVSRVGEIEIADTEAAAARKLVLAVEIEGHRNHWSFWSFPRSGLLTKPAEAPANVRVISRLSKQDAEFLRTGGRLWLLAGREQFQGAGKGTFFPASGGAQGTVLADHPALRGYPHEGFCDLQFFRLQEGAWPFPLDQWPRELSPIAGSIRTTSSFLSKSKELSRTGYIFEGKVGRGSLLVTTLNLAGQLDDTHPEAVYLFDRLLRYASGSEFRPAVEIPAGLLETLVSP